MACWICVTCGNQFADTETPPTACPICGDERQYVRAAGQQWTTPAQMTADGFHTTVKEHEPQLAGIGTEPSFGIGQRALLVQTDEGNVLWDCIGLLDNHAAPAVERLGGIRAIAASHPHFYGSMVDWAERFD